MKRRSKAAWPKHSLHAMMSRSVNMSIEAHGNSPAMHRTGWILSGIVIAFMAADAGANLLAIAPVKKATLETGYPLDEMWLIGALALICLVLYAIPTTSVLGAIILTGFLGGAITSHLRVAGTLTPEMIVSLILGVTAWGGLWFRDPLIRALIPRRHNVVLSAALADGSRPRSGEIS
jgi:hypothetical protein